MSCQRLLVAFSTLISLACGSCSSARITSQADADSLSACPTVTGDVVLATNAAGAIKLDGIKSITGNLFSEQCFSDTTPLPQMGYIFVGGEGDESPYQVYSSNNCSVLSSLASSTLVSVAGNFSLQGLLNITNITFPLLETVGTAFYVDGVPVLDTLSVPQLRSMATFHLAFAQNLTSLTLNNITNVSSIDITDVGLYAPPNLNIDPSNSINDFSIGGIPNIRSLTMATAPTATLSVNGNGFLDLWLYSNVSSALYVSGCSNLFTNSTNTMPLQSFTAIGNSVMDLDMNALGFHNVSNVYVQANPNLRGMNFEPSSDTLDNVVIIDNPSLDSLGAWYVKQVTSFVLKGSFGTAVVNELRYLVNVTAQFVVSSTNTSLDCTTVDAKRKSGLFQGVYSCQGNTVAVVKSWAAPTSIPSYLEMMVFASLVVGLFW